MIDISVITPTFRRPGPLYEAIQSVLSQQDVRVEMHIIDDSPEASAYEVIECINDPRIQYHKMQIPSGGRPSLVRNAGIPFATGRFVHFFDDDDIVPEGTYVSVIKALEEHPYAGVAFGRIEPFGTNTEKLAHEQAYFARAARQAKRIQQLSGIRHLMAARMLCGDTLLVCSAGFIRRECLIHSGGFDVDCPAMEDVEFYTRAIEKFGYIFVDRVVLKYRTGEKSLMNDPEYNSEISNGYRVMHRRYLRDHGFMMLLISKILSKTVLCKL